MADISSKLDKIKSAERGEDVRDAIIGALRDINNDVPADMSNPERVTADMPGGSDLTIPFNPPKLVSEIYVRQAGSGGKSTTLKDITITENGEYPTDEEDYDSSTENRYYKKVKVDVPQLANKIEMDEVVIEQNGTYSATEWGVDGLRTITVNVQAATGDGPFQVEFYDKAVTDPTAAVHETQLIAKGGSAETTYRPTSSLGGFVGWSPSPTNVTRDLKCYPNFAQIIVDPTEIQDSWEVICANGGAPYPIGSHKLLPYGATLTPEEIRRYTSWDQTDNYDLNIYMMMYKIAEGEGNSHSTWLGTRVMFHNFENDAQDWENNSIRRFLNGAFFDHMADIFKNSIVPVTKYSVYLDQAPHPTQDKVWIPNHSEITSWETGLEEAGIYDFANTVSQFIPTGGEGKVWYEAVTRADASSMKYVRDYLNNDRNWPLLFTQTWDGLLETNRFICLRDARGTDRTANSGYGLAYNNSAPYIQTQANNWYHVDYYNLGFCL